MTRTIFTGLKPRFLKPGLRSVRRPSPPQFATKYEKKWHRLGQKEFYKIQLKKTGHTAIPEKEEIPVQSRIITAFDPKTFELATLRDEVLVALKDFLYDSQQQRGMVRALITEEPLTQEIWIEIVLEENGWDDQSQPRAVPWCPQQGSRGPLTLSATWARPDPGALDPSRAHGQINPTL